jgi:CRP-like cAMP-binding protein
MNRQSSVNVHGSNRLLALLPQEDQKRLTSLLEPVHLTRGNVVYEAEKPIQYAHFPLSGLISLVLSMEDGSVVEVGTVGNEGMTAFALLHGSATATTDAICQVAGDLLRMSAEAFTREVNENSQFARVMGRSMQAFFSQVAQTTGCNRLHPVEQRLARWMLMTQDRVGQDRLELTQEFLAQMLGVRRQSVNLVASMLQRAGFIRYQRGIIEIVDRSGLESVSCECYEVVRIEQERLLR